MKASLATRDVAVVKNKPLRVYGAALGCTGHFGLGQLLLLIKRACSVVVVVVYRSKRSWYWLHCHAHNVVVDVDVNSNVKRKAHGQVHGPCRSRDRRWPEIPVTKCLVEPMGKGKCGLRNDCVPPVVAPAGNELRIRGHG